MNNEYLERAKQVVPDAKTLILLASRRANELAYGARPMVRCKDENEAVSFESGVTVDLATGAIDTSAGTTTSEVAVVGTRILKMNDYTDFFVMISPGHAGKTFEFVAVVDGNEVVFAERTVGPEGLKSGKTLVVSADFEVSDEDESD